MNTMELTKIVGALCGALLIFMLVTWAAEVLYHTGGGHGHGDEHMAGYVIEVEEETSSAEVEEGPSLEEMMAAADIEKGAKAFGKCKACHKLEEGANGTGPSLYGVVDRAIGSMDGFGYSGALAGLDGTWDYAALDAFIAKPSKYAPGTSMGFAGLKKPADRANLIMYLESLVK